MDCGSDRGAPRSETLGRTRLQKEVKLLQRLGFPTDYPYMIHFYGPYSESLQSDIGLMEAFGSLEESCEPTRDGNECHVLEARESEDLPDVSKFQQYVDKLGDASTVVLELAGYLRFLLTARERSSSSLRSPAS